MYIQLIHPLVAVHTSDRKWFLLTHIQNNNESVPLYLAAKFRGTGSAGVRPEQYSTLSSCFSVCTLYCVITLNSRVYSWASAYRRPVCGCGHGHMTIMWWTTLLFLTVTSSWAKSKGKTWKWLNSFNITPSLWPEFHWLFKVATVMWHQTHCHMHVSLWVERCVIIFDRLVLLETDTIH